MTHELPKVKICYGYGIVFTIDLHVKKGATNEELQRLAIQHFKKYMPTTEQVKKVEDYLNQEKAWIEVEREDFLE